jgi:hypothetical protein
LGGNFIKIKRPFAGLIRLAHSTTCEIIDFIARFSHQF